MQAKLAQAT